MKFRVVEVTYASGIVCWQIQKKPRFIPIWVNLVDDYDNLLIYETKARACKRVKNEEYRKACVKRVSSRIVSCEEEKI